MKKEIVVTPEQQQIIGQVPNMNLSGLASVCRQDWQNIYFGAKPYLNALASMDTVNDNYGADPGTQIVAYFLGNAQTWRGPIAKAVKAELNKRLKSQP